MTAHTLEMLETLESVGFERKQAKAIVDIVTTRADDTYVTKAEAAQLEGRIEAAIADLRADLHADIARLENKIDTAIAAMSGKIDAMQGSIKLIANMMIGLYIGIALLFLDRLL